MFFLFFTGDGNVSTEQISVSPFFGTLGVQGVGSRLRKSVFRETNHLPYVIDTFLLQIERDLTSAVVQAFHILF